MRHGARLDANHNAIAEGLRAHGVWVHSTAALGGGFVDLVAWWDGCFTLLEVKDPSQPPSARRLTELEQAFFARCPGRKAVVETLEEALVAVGRKRKATA